MKPNNNNYIVHFFKFGLYIRSYKDLSFDEAYKICIPDEENIGRYDKWHFIDKNDLIINENEKVLVSYKENRNYDGSKTNHENNIKNIKYIQEYQMERTS